MFKVPEPDMVQVTPLLTVIGPNKKLFFDADNVEVALAVMAL